MILVDTSVWIEHLRENSQALAGLLDAGLVLIHPFVLGKLALGNLRQRNVVLSAPADLPSATMATDAEALHFIDQHALHGKGIGYVDAHLLVAIRLTPGATLWTTDKRLHAVAVMLGSALTSARKESHRTTSGSAP